MLRPSNFIADARYEKGSARPRRGDEMWAAKTFLRADASGKNFSQQPALFDF
jgi:hypothetical protein